MDWHQLTQIARGQSTEVSSNQTRNVTVRFILLVHYPDFELIGQRTNNPVHLIKYFHGEFYWELSYANNLGIIQEFIHPHQKAISEVDFYERHLKIFSRKPICIGDTPGMGKSVLLCHIANQVKRHHPGRLVLFHTLGELANENMAADDIESVLGHIISHCAENTLSKEVLSILINSKNLKVELFLDGFDEVLPSQISKTRALLITLMNVPNIRIHVTTRPHLLQELEQTLGVLGYTILPFSDHNQVDFLQRYWISEYGALEFKGLYTFSETCLKKLKTNMTDAEGDIAGVPLQCLLLAEVYSTDAVRHSNGNAKFDFTVDISSLFDMYNNLMEFKLRQVEQDHERTINNEGYFWRLWRTLTGEKYRKEKILESHIYEAIKLIFPEWVKIFSEHVKYHEDVILDIYSVGIMEKRLNAEGARFVHRTFAEYLVAYFLASGISENKHCAELLFGTILGKFSESKQSVLGISGSVLRNFKYTYPVISYFVNGHLEKLNVDYNKVRNVITINDSWNPHNMLIACSVNNLPNCFQLIRETLLRDTSHPGSEKFLSSLVLSTTKYTCNEGAVKHTIEFAQDSLQSGILSLNFPVSPEIKSEYTPLHISVETGSYKLTEYFVNLHANLITNAKYLLHLCVRETSSATEGVINQKEQIIRLIVRKDVSKLEERCAVLNSTPLLQPHVHFKLLLCLLKEGADVNAEDINGNNFLHLVCQRYEGMKKISSESFTKLFLVITRHNFGLINSKNSHGKTLLHQAVEIIEVEEDVLDTLKTLGADFNTSDGSCESLLYSAIRHGRSGNFIAKLTNKYGCKLQSTGDEKETAVHVAAKFGNVEAISHFLHIKPRHVNATDKNGNTPLHLAVMKKLDTFKAIQNFLLKNNADCNKTNLFGNIPLIESLENGYGISHEVVLNMVAAGLEIDHVTASNAITHLIKNKSIKALGREHDFTKLFRYFYEAGGVFKFLEFGSDSSLLKTRVTLLQNIIEDLADSTELTDAFLSYFTDIIDAVFHNSKQFYETVIKENIQLEKIMLALLATNQLRAFHLIRVLFQRRDVGPKKFVQAPKAVDNFIESSQQILIFKVIDLDIATDRVLETIPGAIQYQSGTDIPHDSNLCVVTIENVTKNCVHLFDGEASKFLFIVSSLDKQLELYYNVVNDELEWEDLSREFQRQIYDDIQWHDFKLSQQSKLILLKVLKDKHLANVMKFKHVCGEKLRTIVNDFLPKISKKEIRVLGLLAVKEILGHQAFEYAQSGQEDLFMPAVVNLVKKGLLTKGIEPKFTIEFYKWYSLAKLLFQMSKETGKNRIAFKDGFLIDMFLRESLRTYNIGNAILFKNDLLVYLLDELAANDQSFQIEYMSLESVKTFGYACAYSKAFNLLKHLLLNHSNYKINDLPHDLIHVMVTDTLTLPQSKITVCKNLLRRLTNANDGCLKRQDMKNKTAFQMPSIHADLLNLMNEINPNVDP